MWPSYGVAEDTCKKKFLYLRFCNRLKTPAGSALDTVNILYMKNNFAIKGIIYQMIENQVKSRAETAVWSNCCVENNIIFR
jgi:hypothetical protein